MSASWSVLWWFCCFVTPSFSCAQICAASLQQCLSRSLRWVSTYTSCLQGPSFYLSVSSHPNRQTLTQERAQAYTYVKCVHGGMGMYGHKNVKEFSIFHRLKDDFSPSWSICWLAHWTAWLIDHLTWFTSLIHFIVTTGILGLIHCCTKPLVLQETRSW